MRADSFLPMATSDLRFIGVPEPESTALHLLSAYTRAERFYHGIDHPLSICILANFLFGSQSLRALIVRLFAYSHDYRCVANAPFCENERLSLEWLIIVIGQSRLRDKGWIQRLAKLLEQSILATARHSLEYVDKEFHEDVGLNLDFDFLGLSQPQDVFLQDTENLWKECKKFKSREKFDKDCSEWAKDLLAKDKIYYSPEFAMHEEQAQSNLRSLVLN